MSDKTIPPERGGSMFEVTIYRGTSLRNAQASDFEVVRLKASNSIHAQILARNVYAAAVAFDARKIHETKESNDE